MTIAKPIEEFVLINMEFELLKSLLKRRADDSAVRNAFGVDPSTIERDEFYGSIEFRESGFDVVFQKAPWVIPANQITDPNDLYVCGFHFHRKGHEGFERYEGGFPGGVLFYDSEPDVLRKLGKPSGCGGGDWSTLLRKQVPFWFRYSIQDVQLHFQLDEAGKVEMVTLQCEDLTQRTSAT